MFHWDQMHPLLLLNFACVLLLPRLGHGLDIVRYSPKLNFKRTGSSVILDSKAITSSQAGCVSSCLVDTDPCIGFAYSPDLKKCVKSYAVGDLDKLSDGHWKTYYSM